MSKKRPLTYRGVQKLSERERQAGLEPDDAAAKWLVENDKQPPAQAPKSATKSKALHQWRQQQQQRNKKKR